MSAYETATDVMSAIAAVGNFILFSSQIPLVYRLVTVDKDSRKYDFLPSLTLMTTMSLWCGYTVWVLPRVQLFAANFTGIALPLGYLFFFALYSHHDTARRMRIIVAAIVALAVTWGFSAGIYVGNVANATNIGGGVTATVNCTFFLSPLRQLRRAALDLDLSRTPTLLSFVQFWQSVAWVIAAALLEDNFLLGVNSAGLGFACLQLSVIYYVRWRRAKLGLAAGELPSWVKEREEKEKKMMMMDQQQQQVAGNKVAPETGTTPLVVVDSSASPSSSSPAAAAAAEDNNTPADV
jgi:hypothetical protein